MDNRRIDLFVGLFVVVALALGIFARGWLSRAWEETNRLDFSVRFSDARGLKGAEEVRMAGFKIGSVSSVGLTPDFHRAMVRLRVDKKYRIPDDSRIAVGAALLGGGTYITIVPGRSPQSIPEGAVLDGADGAGLDAALAGASKLVNDERMQADLKATLRAVRQASESTARLLGDAQMQRDLRATVSNVRVASESLPAALRQATALIPALQKQLLALSDQSESILKNLETTTQTGARAAKQAEALTGDLRATVNENRKSIQAMLRSANDAAGGVAALTQQAASTVGDPDLRKNLIGVTENLNAASKNFVAISQRLDQTAMSVQTLAGDPKLALDIKETVANLKETSASIKNLAGRVEGLRLPGEKRPGPAATPRPAVHTRLLEPGLTFDSVYDTKGERHRLDVHYTPVRGSRGEFYRIGLTDASERSLLSLQQGLANGLPAGSALRYGLIAGKLGVGGDLRAGPFDFRLDLFDPNRLTLNARAKAYLNANTALTVGVNALGRRGSGAVVGIQFRR